MECTSISIPYPQIGFFTNIIMDYIAQAPDLRPFYQHSVSMEGMQQSIAARKAFPTNRLLLVDALNSQYAAMPPADKVNTNIHKLLDENTFTVVTAHQPNIFTGYLYFIYKIVHIIKLTDELNRRLPENSFVPVYYMGSEDADLDELGKIYMGGEEIKWDTSQHGAVGRMSNKGLGKIIERIKGELGIQLHGEELVTILEEYYTDTSDVQTATFRLVHRLFAGYGLVVLMPDNASLKGAMIDVFTDDLLHQTPSAIVEKTIEELSTHYKVQANPREINLFYLKDNIRERIVKSGADWKVVGNDIHFTEETLLDELRHHPERFSPNVILRGLFQETILPNIAFIGGGGETAYWLELRELFHHYHVPFPVLMLRNSFLFIEKKYKSRIQKLEIDSPMLFQEEKLILDSIVKKNSDLQLQLDQEISGLTDIYAGIEKVAGAVDSTLRKHVVTLRIRAAERLYRLEKKMLLSEKRKFSDQQNQVHNLKTSLFPRKGLQERVDNFMPYYAKYGDDFIRMIYDFSPTFEQEFVVIEEV